MITSLRISSNLEELFKENIKELIGKLTDKIIIKQLYRARRKG